MKQRQVVEDLEDELSGQDYEGVLLVHNGQRMFVGVDCRYHTVLQVLIPAKSVWMFERQCEVPIIEGVKEGGLIGQTPLVTAAPVVQ